MGNPMQLVVKGLMSHMKNPMVVAAGVDAASCSFLSPLHIF